MKKYLLLILFLCLATAGTAQAQKKCSYNTSGPGEAPGSHMRNEVNGGTLSFLRGRVIDGSGAPVVNAGVFLSRITKTGKTTVGSQETDVNGGYCFGTQPPGKYVLSSGSSGFNSTIVYIKIVSADNPAAKRKIDIVLEPGT